MQGFETVAKIAWGHAGIERISFVVGLDGRWIAGLGGPLVMAVDSAQDTTELFARLVLATDPFGLEPVQVGEAGRTLTIELRALGAN